MRSFADIPPEFAQYAHLAPIMSAKRIRRSAAANPHDCYCHAFCCGQIVQISYAFGARHMGRQEFDDARSRET